MLGRVTDTQITSAVFNEDASCIIASIFSLKDHLLILDPVTLAIKKTLSIDISENCIVSDFTIYTLSSYYAGNLMAYGSVFPDSEAVDNKMGMNLYFWFGINLNEKSDIKSIKDSKRMKYFYTEDKEFEYQDESNPPTFRTEFLQSKEN